MIITEVRIKLMNQENENPLVAFASITLDSILAICDLKVIEGKKGIFVAMPSCKLMARCRRCRSKNHLLANFCNECGTELHPIALPMDSSSPRINLYADIVHPIHQAGRTMITRAVLNAYYEEQEHSQSPDYVCKYNHVNGDEVA